MKIIGSVIARLGSKRLTFKNLLPFQGVPLVRHAINRLLKSEIFDEVILFYRQRIDRKNMHGREDKNPKATESFMRR